MKNIRDVDRAKIHPAYREWHELKSFKRKAIKNWQDVIVNQFDVRRILAKMSRLAYNAGYDRGREEAYGEAIKKMKRHLKIVGEDF